MKEKAEPLSPEAEAAVRKRHARTEVVEPTPWLLQRLFATLDAERARAAQIAEDRDAAWRDVEKLQTAYDAVQSGHGWCRCHDALVPVLEERDALREEVALLRLAAQTMHDWCDDVRKDTEHPCDFMRPGYEPGDTIFRKLGDALALTPADAVARIEALEAVERAARKRVARGHDANCGSLTPGAYQAECCSCGYATLRDALAHPALRDEVTTRLPASPAAP